MAGAEPGLSVRLEWHHLGHQRRCSARGEARENHAPGAQTLPDESTRHEDLMDLPTKPLVNPGPASESPGRRGIALPSAMFALVAAGILAAGMFAFADLSGKATLNQERSTRAMHVAEAGLSHGVSLLRTSLRMH